jgi:hypothetical protein
MGSDLLVPACVAASTSRLTWPGCSTARACAVMPPIDQPSTAGRPSRSAVISALVCPAMAEMVSGAGSAAVPPTPALPDTTPSPA